MVAFLFTNTKENIFCLDKPVFTFFMQDTIKSMAMLLRQKITSPPSNFSTVEVTTTGLISVTTHFSVIAVLTHKMVIYAGNYVEVLMSLLARALSFMRILIVTLCTSSVHEHAHKIRAVVLRCPIEIYDAHVSA